MSLTDAQREAAIKRMADAIKATAHESSFAAVTEEAAAALTALTDAGFLLLHRDDVTREWRDESVYPAGWVGADDSHLATHSRLVTRWEPITDPTRKDKNDD